MKATRPTTTWSDETLRVAAQLGVDATDRKWMQMIDCGLHSGFPVCCVAFFVKIWWPYTLALDVLSVRPRADALGFYDAYQRWTTRPGYVPCPSRVVEKKFVEVKACDCELTRHAKQRSRRS